MSRTITIVEDDEELAASMSAYLITEDYQVEVIHDGVRAIEVIPESQPDLVILDLMLPGADGVEVCRKVRKSFSNPIVMLTASDNEFAEIAALNLGADSYLTKPIKPQVLLAHIQATLRRSNLSPPTTRSGETIEVQDISLNHTKREVRLSGEIIELTTGEYEVLYLLMLNAGNNVSRDELYLKVKGMEYDGIDRSIDLRISHLRKKLGDEEMPYRYLKTVRNKGYQLAI